MSGREGGGRGDSGGRRFIILTKAQLVDSTVQEIAVFPDPSRPLTVGTEIRRDFVQKTLFQSRSYVRTEGSGRGRGNRGRRPCRERGR